jgi:hypothetical protein
MARCLEKHEESAEFAREARALRDAINAHLRNPGNGLYYLNIELDGRPRSDVTSDLVFPVMFGVAPERTASAIIARLSHEDFWTDAGIRTSPRDAPNYTPDGGWGLLGGVWVGVSFWYAFAAARYSPEFMADALSMSFRNYASDPRAKNTVPGQFSEWLHGETLVNQGMMLSPWFPPRYLWAAIEGMAGFEVTQAGIQVSPRLAPDWKWLAVENLPFRDRTLIWFAARMRNDINIFTNFSTPTSNTTATNYEEDLSSGVQVTGDALCSVGFRQAETIVVFVGNTDRRTSNTLVRLSVDLAGSYRLRTYNSMLGEWVESQERLTVDEVRRGLNVDLEGRGFAILELQQET